MILTLFLGLLIVLFVVGMPIPYAIAFTSLVVMIANAGGIDGVAFHTIAQKMVAGTNSFTILAIPFFLFAGKLMNTGSITRKIFRFCNGVVGWIPGGLGHANVLASVVFAGMSGSAVADAAGLGTIEIEAMKAEGFGVDFAAAITAASATIGPIIPPSIPLVIYGVSAGNVSIADLLIGGVVPGLLMAFALSLLVAYYAVKRCYPKRSLPGFTELALLFVSAFFPLLTPVILIGGVLRGVFTPTEAAAVAALYAFILTFIAYREVSLEGLVRIVRETIVETASILLIVGASTLYGYLLIRTNMPTQIMQMISEFTNNKYAILLLINIFLLLVGCFMETNAAVMIFAPILLPLAVKVGIDPVHLGIIMVLNLMIGMLTPPVGMCLFATGRVANIGFDRMVRAIAPFYIPLAISLVLVTYIPQLVLWLPNSFKVL